MVNNSIRIISGIRQVFMLSSVPVLIALSVACTPGIPDSETPNGIWKLQVPSEVNAALSPNINYSGNQISFIGFLGERTSNLYLIDVPLEKPHILLSDGRYSPITNPEISPDGERIVFGGSSDSPAGAAGIWVMAITNEPEFIALGYDGTWSGDGQKIAAINLDQKKIIVHNLEDHTSKVIFEIEKESSERITDVSWSQDNKYLAFVSEEESNGDIESKIFRIGPDGTSLEIVLDHLGGLIVTDLGWIRGSGWLYFLLGSGRYKSLNLIDPYGECDLVEIPGFVEIGSIDLSQNGLQAAYERGGDLFFSDLNESLSPQTLDDYLECN